MYRRMGCGETFTIDIVLRIVHHHITCDIHVVPYDYFVSSIQNRVFANDGILTDLYISRIIEAYPHMKSRAFPYAYPGHPAQESANMVGWDVSSYMEDEYFQLKNNTKNSAHSLVNEFATGQWFSVFIPDQAYHTPIILNFPRGSIFLNESGFCRFIPSAENEPPARTGNIQFFFCAGNPHIEESALLFELKKIVDRPGMR